MAGTPRKQLARMNTEGISSICACTARSSLVNYGILIAGNNKGEELKGRLLLPARGEIGEFGHANGGRDKAEEKRKRERETAKRPTKEGELTGGENQKAVYAKLGA